MREPQVVRIPSVRKISLSANGIPVSRWHSPEAIRWSAALAAASACSGVTVMKEPICGSTDAMRSSIAVVASTEETCFPFSAAWSSWMVISKIFMVRYIPCLFDDFWDGKESACSLRGVGQSLLQADGRLHNIFTKRIFHRYGVRSWYDSFRIQSFQLFHIPEDCIHLTGKKFLFSMGELKPGQTCHMLDICYRYLHSASSEKI